MRVVVVTGSTGLIGDAFVQRFLQAGDQLVLLDLIGPKDDLPVEAQATFIPVDLTKDESIDAAWQTIQGRFPSIDLFINNAAVGGTRHALHEYPKEILDVILMTNIRAPFLMMQHAIKAMLPVQRGCIINIASTAAARPFPTAAPYSLSKSAVVAMSRAAAIEYASKGVRVLSLSPGSMERPNIQGFSTKDLQNLTDAVPSGRLCTAAEIADVAFFLASDAARHITGQDIVVDGGSLLK